MQTANVSSLWNDNLPFRAPFKALLARLLQLFQTYTVVPPPTFPWLGTGMETDTGIDIPASKAGTEDEYRHRYICSLRYRIDRMTNSSAFKKALG
jgi:hypothetical protein